MGQCNMDNSRLYSLSRENVGRLLLSKLYAQNLSLLTDLYQLTMGYGYFRHGLAEREAVFHLFFRRAPFQGAFAIAAGLETALDYLQNFHFAEDDIAYLASLPGNDGQPLFARDYLDYLGQLELSCDIDAIPEGTPVFPHEPLLRVRGPLLQCQLLETALLNQLNFQTLIATKAARVVQAAEGGPVLEFGLRRAQGIDGGLSAARAAYIGGCAATSNVLAGKLYGIPVKGTHAHSWVMSFDSELASFQHYAAAMPNNCVFLVDTYDTLDGVRNAIEVGKALREQGHEMVGVRLDSGDLGELSVAARRLLDAAGFPQAAIVASNDLNEFKIHSLKQRGARIGIWGVGTELVTAYQQAALGGVYKLSSIRDENGAWQPKLKRSNDLIKVSNPGIQQVRRFFGAEGRMQADMIYDELQAPAENENSRLVELGEPGLERELAAAAPHQDLLQAVLRGGQACYQPPPLAEVRRRAQTQLAQCPPELLDLFEPAAYPVGLESRLDAQKRRLLEAMA